MKSVKAIFSLGCLFLIWRPTFCQDIFDLTDAFDLFGQGGQGGEYSEDDGAVDDSMTVVLKKATCPLGLAPYYLRNVPKSCVHKQIRSCPQKTYSCHEDAIANVSICCGKIDGCQHGSPQINTQTNRPITCSLNVKVNASQCQPTFECQERRRGIKIGFCCPPPAPTPTPTPSRTGAQRQPPMALATTGCPWGTKEAKTSEATAVGCDIEKPDSCPKGAKCYYDNSENASKCCLPDQSDGCPGGFKPMKIEGEKIGCSPNISDLRSCPPNSFCHWSFSKSSYHCCEIDNGCPENTFPILEPNNEPRKCSNQSQCLDKATTCEFNSWRGHFQCCKNVTDICTRTEIPVLDAKTRRPLECSLRKPCSGNAVCRNGNGPNSESICCSPIGRCPEGYVSVEDAKTWNTFVNGSSTCDVEKKTPTCTSPAACLRAVDAPKAIFLCCLPLPRCPYSNQSPHLEMEKPRTCTNLTSSKSQCPAGFRCEPSTLPSINICCSTVARSPEAQIGLGSSPNQFPISAIGSDLTCPEKYEIQKQGAVNCDPQAPIACNAGSKCLLSNKPNYFVCCTPSSPMSNAKCAPDGVFMWRQTDGPQPCNPNYIFTGCPQTHPLCLFYAPIGRHSCCRAPVCPNGNEPFWTLGTTVPRHCGTVESGDCPTGYLCLYSPVFEASVCCLSRFRMRNVYGSTGHLGSTFKGNAQEQRRLTVLNPWTQYYGDVGWTSAKK